MISFDFAYYKPATLNEAAACYAALTAQGKAALYYGGGTEIISMARADSIGFDALIDIKGIPECGALGIAGGDLVIGSAVTLTGIAESGLFPLLGKTAARIADHTIQGKITLGGNLGGTIIYREAALPLMITDCRAKVMTGDGLVETPFSHVFDGRLNLAPGSFLVQVLLDKGDAMLPHNHVKKTRMDKIDYPLISLAANKKGGLIRAAVSGAGNTPMLLSASALNNTSVPIDARADEVIAQIEDAVTGDMHASRAYRMFVLRNVLLQLFENLKGV